MISSWVESAANSVRTYSNQLLPVMAAMRIRVLEHLVPGYLLVGTTATATTTTATTTTTTTTTNSEL